MNDSIITTASWLFMLSLYALIFKAVSTFKAGRLKKQEEATRKERVMKDILALSKQEIAILKFVLKQGSSTAWLPDNCKQVIILVEKGYLVQIGFNSKPISDLRLSFHYSLVHLFSVPENVQKIIADMPQEFVKKWRRIKPDRSFKDCQ